jgi:hypothetical protein
MDKSAHRLPGKVVRDWEKWHRSRECAVAEGVGFVPKNAIF